MSRSVRVSETVSVECFLEDFDDDDLIEEVKERGITDCLEPDFNDLGGASIEQLTRAVENHGLSVLDFDQAIIQDHVYNLFDDYIQGRELDLKAFFLATIDKRII